MPRRQPAINDWAMLDGAERMLKQHRRYRKLGECDKPKSAEVRTAVEVSVIRLTKMVPDGNPKRRVPHASSLAYRSVITSTTRDGSGGQVSWKQKKQLRRKAYESLVEELDFLDS